MKRVMVTMLLAMLLGPVPALAQLREMRQTIHGMD
jgi:hypothetical protein